MHVQEIILRDGRMSCLCRMKLGLGFVGMHGQLGYDALSWVAAAFDGHMRSSLPTQSNAYISVNTLRADRLNIFSRCIGQKDNASI